MGTGNNYTRALIASVLSFLFVFIATFLFFGFIGSQVVSERYAIVWNIFLILIGLAAGGGSAKTAWKLESAKSRSKSGDK